MLEVLICCYLKFYLTWPLSLMETTNTTEDEKYSGMSPSSLRVWKLAFRWILFFRSNHQIGPQ